MKPTVIVDAFNTGQQVFIVSEVLLMASDIATIFSFIVLCAIKMLPILYSVSGILLQIDAVVL